jgi:hypothetical protein
LALLKVIPSKKLEMLEKKLKGLNGKTEKLEILAREARKTC